MPDGMPPTGRALPSGMTSAAPALSVLCPNPPCHLDIILTSDSPSPPDVWPPGAKSSAFFKQQHAKKDQDWLCFSLVFKGRGTLDFAATNADALLDWYLARRSMARLAALAAAELASPRPSGLKHRAVAACGCASPVSALGPRRSAARTPIRCVLPPRLSLTVSGKAPKRYSTRPRCAPASRA